MSKELESLEKIKENLILIHSRYPHDEYPNLNDYVVKLYKIDIIETALKAFEIIKELLNLKVVELLPYESDTRLFLQCGNFKASISIPPAYIDLFKEEIKNHEKED